MSNTENKSDNQKKSEDFCNNDDVTRIEVIDHSPNGSGRSFVRYGVKKIEFSYQDEGRTLKIFVE